MFSKATRVRVAVGAVGGLSLAGVAVAAVAAPVDDDGVEVYVQIDERDVPGALSLTVDATSTTLSEEETAEDLRQFTGALPAVTVTDTRTSGPEGAYWYVTGQASDFTGDGVEPLTPDHLGWSPSVVTENDGEVAAGEEVGTVLTDEPGLAGEELLYLALDSDDARPTGEWTATADLLLQTPTDVAPGSYVSTITLSLFEDVG